jgi:hypothetical protein
VIDGMTLAEAGEIFAYWEQNPPPHLMLQAIARMLGWLPPSAPFGKPRIEDIAAAAPPGLLVARGGDPGTPAPLDIDTLRARNRALAIAIARRNQSVAVG